MIKAVLTGTGYKVFSDESGTQLGFAEIDEEGEKIHLKWTDPNIGFWPTRTKQESINAIRNASGFIPGSHRTYEVTADRMPRWNE